MGGVDHDDVVEVAHVEEDDADRAFVFSDVALAFLHSLADELWQKVAEDVLVGPGLGLDLVEPGEVLAVLDAEIVGDQDDEAGVAAHGGRGGERGLDVGGPGLQGAVDECADGEEE